MSVLMADTTKGTPAVAPATFMGLPIIHSRPRRRPPTTGSLNRPSTPGAGIPNYWRVEIGKDGPTVHLYTLVTRTPARSLRDPSDPPGGAYTRTRVVRPGHNHHRRNSPWKIVLTPPEHA
jgi:hypothetical protein